MGEELSKRLTMTTQMVAAYVSQNEIEAHELPSLIGKVYEAISPKQEHAPDQPTPAVPIKRSVFPDYIICLEDGRKLKMLKRHLQATYGMTPTEYRIKWGLPEHYPMVAPNYAARRSELAKELGLGRDITSLSARQNEQPQQPAKRGRKKKAV
ncbi:MULTISPECIES: MucR family transcriptional regulator [Komagataeibacter]|uniref:MucR family transcriptional regulator n=1 Tax=Komagataeibacter oboediens TaxID=65958 RepID=A0A318QR18_9PROT|nr:MULTISPECIES: MucR family transcriptional regulator [Komagataeibacter]PYD79762.1 MucR family transcriptional regulator [Komagataeibacter oboediens]